VLLAALTDGDQYVLEGCSFSLFSSAAAARAQQMPLSRVEQLRGALLHYNIFLACKCRLRCAPRQRGMYTLGVMVGGFVV
jgi:hypothetical protein